MDVKPETLFGGDLRWKEEDWVASDDRVRGGKSESHLDPQPHPHPPDSTACFHGNLDINTLGGAGFASQRTTTDTFVWNLAPYAGIRLLIEDGDEKKYTFILKDEIPETYVSEQTGKEREQASVSWEFDFRLSMATEAPRSADTSRRTKLLFIPWDDFKPTYRGKEKKDAKPLNLKAVRRMSLMMRSFFGSQQGPFNLKLRSIEAITADEARDEQREEPGSMDSYARVGLCRHADSGSKLGSDSGSSLDYSSESEKPRPKLGEQSRQPGQQTWLRWLLGGCGKL